MKRNSLWKKYLLLMIGLAAVMHPSMAEAGDGEQVNEREIKVDDQHFPDNVFRAYISENFDLDKNAVLSSDEIEQAKIVDFMWGEYRVTDLTGIEYLSSLEELRCSSIGIKSLDISHNTELRYLECTYNPELTELDVSQNMKLEEIHCYETGVSSLDVSSNPLLRRLDCNHTDISTLDVTQNSR